MRILIALLLLVLAWPAQAQPDNQSWRTIRKEFKIRNWDGSYSYGHRYVRVPYEPRVYGYTQYLEDEPGWNRRDPRLENGVSCKEVAPIRVVGGSHLTEPGAMKDVVGAWERTVSYDFGEKYASISNARGYQWRCDKASTNESALGRVAAGVGDVLSGGQAETYRKRCVVRATPCMQPMQAGDQDKR